MDGLDYIMRTKGLLEKEPTYLRAARSKKPGFLPNLSAKTNYFRQKPGF
jgi:hypothetical protein